MKALVIIFLSLPSFLFAQDITGVWTGSLTTSEKQLPYEVVISDSSGILIGYSHITFIVNGKKIIAVKKVGITCKDDIITLEDEDLITDNFTDAEPKRIKQIATLELIKRNSLLFLEGTFKTKKVVGLRPISGDIELQKRGVDDSSQLMAKLNDLNLRSSLSFLQLKKMGGKIAPGPLAASQLARNSNTLTAQKLIAVAPVIIPKVRVVAAPQKPIMAAVLKPEPKKPPVVKEEKAIAAAPKVIKRPPVIVTPPIAKPIAVAAPPPATPKVVAVTIPPVPKVNKPDVIPAGAGSDIAHRQIENIETFYIQSDSIKITLYDNGIVDGDTVTIFLNGKVIMGKVGLSTDPVSKMIYVTPDLGDSLQFIMYAENLGSIPPNTGLMILQDGKKRHEIFFSGDLQKNAAITLRRKPELN